MLPHPSKLPRNPLSTFILSPPVSKLAYYAADEGRRRRRKRRRKRRGGGGGEGEGGVGVEEADTADWLLWFAVN